MARPLRIEYAGAWYHVMNRGCRRENIFLTKADCQSYLHILEKCLDYFELEVHAYSLMPNHYHLLVRTPRGNLSRAMRYIDGVYTQRFNRRHGHDGPLLRGRYKAILVDADTYVKELVRYIHRNPLEAGLERTLGEHPWTSHRYYLRKAGRPDWLQRNFVLRYFDEKPHEAVKRLHAFVEKASIGELKKRLDDVKWPVLLGGKSFAGRIKERFLSSCLGKKEIPQLNELLREKKIADLMETAERLWGIEPDHWKRLRRGYKNDKRRAMIYASRAFLKASGREISDAFGGISYAAISMQCRLAEEEITKQSGCSRAVSELRETVNLQLKT